jgi:hypothetical protein
MPIPGNLLTTAMAVMPHRDVDRALEVALSLDIPFWPQLPLVSYYEDMYVQASEHFPGIVLDLEKRKLRFSMDKFVAELEETMAHFDEPEYFDISEQYSVVYHRFLQKDFSRRPAVRGQIEGPISFGFNVVDQDDRPILFNDEPGLQFLFSALAGYGDLAARGDMENFFAMIERPRGVHLCGNPDWDFLLGLDMDVLSMDVYSNGEVFTQYGPSIKKFLDRGGRLVWGIVPSNVEPFEEENLDTLEQRLVGIWTTLDKKGIDREFLLSRSMLSPATCCLVNPDGEKTVEEAFETTMQLSRRLRQKMNLLEG